MLPRTTGIRPNPENPQHFFESLTVFGTQKNGIATRRLRGGHNAIILDCDVVICPGAIFVENTAQNPLHVSFCLYTIPSQRVHCRKQLMGSGLS